jgi:hypothetical protein
MTADNLKHRAAAKPAARKTPHRPMLDAPTAQYPGECAWCGKFIVPERSKIVRLDVALPPSPDSVYPKRGGLASRKTGEPVILRRRTYAHLACANEIDAAEVDLELVAAERRETLVKMRKEARKEARLPLRPRRGKGSR